MPDVSVVCPFFNEAAIVRRSAESLHRHLTATEPHFEILLVDDGSTDGGRASAEAFARENANVRVLGYAKNRGRGYALRTGIAAAKGDIVCTTEIDLSCGCEIVTALCKVLRSEPDVDMVVASPNSPGGAYVGVPRLRTVATRLGNRFIRWAWSSDLHMFTGMTRAYRRDVVQSLPAHEDGKEFHLEMLLKAQSLGCRVTEIPATLTWDAERRERGRSQAQMRVTHRLVRSHLPWIVLANPGRIAWNGAVVCFLFAAAIIGIVLTTSGSDTDAAANWLAGAQRLGMVGVLLVIFSMLSTQVRTLLVEMWRQERDRRAMSIAPVRRLAPTTAVAMTGGPAARRPAPDDRGAAARAPSPRS